MIMMQLNRYKTKVVIKKMKIITIGILMSKILIMNKMDLYPNLNKNFLI